jgi:hypothetical protein
VHGTLCTIPSRDINQYPFIIKTSNFISAIFLSRSSACVVLVKRSMIRLILIFICGLGNHVICRNVCFSLPGNLKCYFWGTQHRVGNFLVISEYTRAETQLIICLNIDTIIHLDCGEISFCFSLSLRSRRSTQVFNYNTNWVTSPVFIFCGTTAHVEPCPHLCLRFLNHT